MCDILTIFSIVSLVFILPWFHMFQPVPYILVLKVMILCFPLWYWLVCRVCCSFAFSVALVEMFILSLGVLSDMQGYVLNCAYLCIFNSFSP